MLTELLKNYKTSDRPIDVWPRLDSKTINIIFQSNILPLEAQQCHWEYFDITHLNLQIQFQVFRLDRNTCHCHKITHTQNITWGEQRKESTIPVHSVSEVRK